MLERNALARTSQLLERRLQLSATDAVATADVHFDVERRKVHSVEQFATLTEDDHAAAMGFLGELQTLVAPPEANSDSGRNETVYERNSDIQGPMGAFGYSYLSDKYGQENLADLRLRQYNGAHGSGGQYVYEALNFVDGQRTVSDIRDWLTTELGPVPIEYVEEYLAALESIEVIRIKK
jgi:hypothetical protein